MASILSISDIPTLNLLYRTGRLARSTVAPTKSSSTSFNAKISTIQHDITKLRVDAIVNAANESLLGGAGVDGAIHSAAGPELYDECHNLDGCVTGSAKITKGYKLPSNYVVHAVGPRYLAAKRNLGPDGPAKLLCSCYRTALDLAVQKGCKSIAFSALSTGVYGYPSGEAAETALGEVRRYLDAGDGAGLEKIIFCNFMDKDVRAYENWLPILFPPALENHSVEEGKSIEEQKAPEESVPHDGELAESHESHGTNL